MVREEGVGRRTTHAGDHEGGKDEAEGRAVLVLVPRREGGRPVEDEDVHAALEERDGDPAQHERRVRQRGNEHAAKAGPRAGLERGRTTCATLPLLVAAGARSRLAIVLRPAHADEDEAEQQETGGEVEGRGVAAIVPRRRCGGGGEWREVGGRLRDQAGADSADRVAKVHEREAVGERRRIVPARVVLADEPRLARVKVGVRARVMAQGYRRKVRISI